MNDDKQVIIEHEPQKIHPLAVRQEQLMELMKVAVQSEGGVEKLQQIMDLQDRWEQSNAKKAFNSAMSRFQSILPVIEKRGIVDYTSDKGRTYYQYAKLEDIAQAIQSALKETGLSYRFKQTQESGVIAVSCIVTHEDGHSDSTEMASAPDSSGGKSPLKSIASAVSYLRRYTLTGILGIVVGGEDDESDPAEESGETAGNCYPDEKFEESFPRWSQMILDGKKTVDQLHEFLTKKKIILSKYQYTKLKQVGK